VAEAVLTSLEERERVFRRAVAISAGAHLALVLFALVAPFPRSHSMTLPGVVNVSLVAAAPSAPSAARPAPKPPAPPPAEPKASPALPKPAPPPPPKPEVKADKKLLPKEAVREPKPAPPKPKPAVAPPKPEQKLDYEGALDALREDLGEEASDGPDPDLLASVRPGPKAGPAGGGAGAPVDPEVAAWMRRVKIHVTRNWVLQPGFKRQAIQAVVEVTLDATGNVLEIQVTEGSGNPYYDQSVVRAVEKASPLPPPPESGDWPMLFSPQDLL
jgi:periplasmic protein TonB